LAPAESGESPGKSIRFNNDHLNGIGRGHQRVNNVVKLGKFASEGASANIDTSALEADESKSSTR